MKIGFFFDLHYVALPKYNWKIGALKRAANTVDAIVLGGDNAEYDSKLISHTNLYKTVTSTSVPVAKVLGNHEIIKEKLRFGLAPEDFTLASAVYANLDEEFGIINLEKQNLEIGGVVVAGSYGHYDGTLDGRQIKNNQNDIETVRGLIGGLEARAQGADIILTHTVPRVELLGRPNTGNQYNFTPYAGSSRIQEMLATIQPRVHLCGHTHASAEQHIGGTRSINIGNDDETFRYVVVDTETLEVELREE